MKEALYCGTPDRGGGVGWVVLGVGQKAAAEAVEGEEASLHPKWIKSRRDG